MSKHENTVKNTAVDNTEDSYDLLDSMLEDITSGDELSSTDPDVSFTQAGSADVEHPDSTGIEVVETREAPIMSDSDGGAHESVESVTVEKPRKRVPLFQQVKDNDDEKVSVEDEVAPEVEQSTQEISEDLEVDNERIEPAVDTKGGGLFGKLARGEALVEHSEPEVAPEVEDKVSEEVIEVLEVLEETTEKSTEVSRGGADEFDSMLAELDEEEVPGYGIGVEAPIENDKMTEVKVTADGKTLAEVLPTLRGGRRRADEVLKDMRDENKHVKVGDKVKTDDRYLKHVDKVESKSEEQETRVKLSNKFIQRNAKFTEQEKIIMENLGITNEQFVDLMGSKELTMKEKEEVLGLGRYGPEKHFKGRRYRTTVGDMAMLEFLTKFKFANTRILRWISNEPQGRTWRKLNRLRENGLVESQTLIGVPDLWAATYAGVAVSGYDFAPGLRPMPKMITVSSTMGVNYLAACLWFNTVNVLNLDDFPAHNRVISTQEDGRDRVRGEMLVSELEIRSSLGKEINPQSTTMKNLGDQRLYDVISANVRGEFEAWEASGRVGESPEMLIGNEYMWVLYPTSGLTLSYHVPDLVVKRDRGPNGEPRSIAVEVERYDKSNDKYDKIMMAYKLDEHLYEKVIWVTPNTRVARKLQQAAEAVGFDRYTIVPIITEDGVYDKHDIWMI